MYLYIVRSSPACWRTGAKLVTEAVTVTLCTRPMGRQHHLYKRVAHVVRPLSLDRERIERVPLEATRLGLVVSALHPEHDLLVVRTRVRHDVGRGVAVLARVVGESVAITTVHLRRVLAHTDRMGPTERQLDVDAEIALVVELQGVLDGLVKSDHAADDGELARKAPRPTTDDTAEQLTRLRVLLDDDAVDTGHGTELRTQGPDRSRDPPVRLDELIEIRTLGEDLGELPSAVAHQPIRKVGSRISPFGHRKPPGNTLRNRLLWIRYVIA